MATIVELVAEIVASHASSNSMSSDELVQEIEKVHAALLKLEGQQGEVAGEQAKPALTVKQAFKKDEVVCLLCGKGKMKTLARHLKVAHDMKPGQYRKQFGIPRTQALAAKSFTESRRKMAEERGLGEVLVKARAVRAANLKSKGAAKPKAAEKAKPAATKAGKAKGKA